MYLCLWVFLMQTLMLLTPHQHSLSEYHIAKNLLEKGSAPFRELWGWRGLSPSCRQFPTHQLMWFHCQGKSTGPWPDRSGNCSRRWSQGQSLSLPSLLCWETNPETHKKHLPPPLLTDVQAALLYFGSLQSKGGALREGERTGGAEGQKLQLDQCMKAGRALSPTASVQSHASAVCVCAHYSQSRRAIAVSLIPAELPDTPERFGQNVWWRAEPWEVRVNPVPYRDSSTRGRHCPALFPLSLCRVSPGVTHLQWGVSSLQRRTMESFPGGSGVVDMMLSLRFRRVCLERETKRCQKGYLAEMCSHF